jgi:hypothetical protein
MVSLDQTSGTLAEPTMLAAPVPCVVRAADLAEQCAPDIPVMPPCQRPPRHKALALDACGSIRPRGSVRLRLPGSSLERPNVLLMPPLGPAWGRRLVQARTRPPRARSAHAE